MNRKDRRASRHSEAGAAPAGATPSPSDSAFAAAVARHQAGALAEAEQLYRQLLAADPSHSDSVHNLGLIALQRGNAAAAADLIGAAIAADDGIAEYHYNLGLAMRTLGRIDDAASGFERATELRDNYPAAHLNLGNIRWEQGQRDAAAASYERALAHAPQSADTRFNLANVRSEQGRWEEAILAYRQILANHPGHAESHNNLGAALLAQGKTADAARHIERALALKPDLFDAYGNLGRAYMAAGQFPQALAAARRALEIRETDAGKELFAQCARFLRFSADDGEYRPWLLRAVSEAWARPGDLARVAASLIRANPAVDEMIARAEAAGPVPLPAADLFGASGLAVLAADPLLCRLLEAAPLTDVGLERLLAGARSVLLATAQSDRHATDEAKLAFWCALARQCFINQYVYALSDDESERAVDLRDTLAAALAAGSPVSALWAVAVAAYFPLAELLQAPALANHAWPACVRALVVQQVDEPAQEQAYRNVIPVVTEIEDAAPVRRQYEESPYPRWVTAGPPGQPVSFSGLPTGQGLDILIAGCGTGQFAIEFARHARDARFLALDLSLSSLSYAKRMAERLGTANIAFAQADIMRLGGIDRMFDVIEVGGVLHHLADPWEGWRILLPLLRPGGVMRVSLYSALARQPVLAARELIAERGYQPVLENIRRCRADIMAAPDGTVLKSLMLWHDFFTTAECRDLLFHPQEHLFTLPEIKAFLGANGLHFAGFVLDAPIEQRFSARFPGHGMLTDLDRWHTYETENPDTFVSMYQFWVQKPEPGTDVPSARLQ